MNYSNIHKATFISRPNRFIAHVKVNGSTEICHVKNTGRCKELLLPGCTVYVQYFDSDKRKTKWDLIAVEKNGIMINIDSQAPNKAAKEWLASGGLGFIPDYLKAEYTYGDSRFDFYLEHGTQRWLIEVKGVTLEEDHVAMFPDAPTERGVKHVQGLARHVQEGFHTAILFVIQMKSVHTFTPHTKMQPEFAEALKNASLQGVYVLAYDCEVTPDSMMIKDSVTVRLS